MGMLEGKVAFITGGASGIGAGTGRRFAREGAKVALADVQEDDGERLRDEIRVAGGEVIYAHCDVSDPDLLSRAVVRPVEGFGRLDIVFANAGINGTWAPVDELKPEEWDKTLAINLRGTFLTVHFAVPYLKQAGGGSILITSSVNGTRTFSNPGAHAYSSSKAAQVAFMKVLAAALRGRAWPTAKSEFAPSRAKSTQVNYPLSSRDSRAQSFERPGRFLVAWAVVQGRLEIGFGSGEVALGRPGQPAPVERLLVVAYPPQHVIR